MRIALLILTLACNTRPLGVQFPPEEEPLVPSTEPFVENLRFCGHIGNACRVQPTPC